MPSFVRPKVLCLVAVVGLTATSGAAPPTRVRGEALVATMAAFRSRAVVLPGLDDGLSLPVVRLGLDVTTRAWLALRVAPAVDSNGSLGPTVAYADFRPATGLALRVGRWGLDAAAAIEARPFADATLGTERFLGGLGLIDHGLGATYVAPIPGAPLTLSVAALSGSGGRSFGPVGGVGTGAGFFKRLTYVTAVGVDLGPLLGSGRTLALGFRFLTGINATGPANRTDLLGVDVRLDTDAGPVRVFAEVEYLARRLSVPFALDVEGALSIGAGVSWRGLEAGLRADLLGLPAPPPSAGLRWRTSVAVGYRVDPLTVLRLQYAARTDVEDDRGREIKTLIGHEVLLSAIVGFQGPLGGGREPRPARLSPKRLPRARHDAGPLLAEAKDDLAGAMTLLEAGRPGPSLRLAVRAGQAAVMAVARHRSVPLDDRPLLPLLRALIQAGATPSESTQAAVRGLTRGEAILDSPAGAEAIDTGAARQSALDARELVAWAELELLPPSKSR